MNQWLTNELQAIMHAVKICPKRHGMWIFLFFMSWYKIIYHLKMRIAWMNNFPTYIRVSKHYFKQTSNYFWNKKEKEIFQNYFGKGISEIKKKKQFFKIILVKGFLHKIDVVKIFISHES
jgi:hypothetical protein